MHAASVKWLRTENTFLAAIFLTLAMWGGCNVRISVCDLHGKWQFSHPNNALLKSNTGVMEHDQPKQYRNAFLKGE